MRPPTTYRGRPRLTSSIWSSSSITGRRPRRCPRLVSEAGVYEGARLGGDAKVLSPLPKALLALEGHKGLVLGPA